MRVSDFKITEGTIKIRKPFWHNKGCYLELTFQDGLRTPWAQLYDEFGNKAVGAENPQHIIFFDDGKDDWELYEEKV